MDDQPALSAMRDRPTAQHAQMRAARARARAHRQEREREDGYLAAIDRFSRLLTDLSAAGSDPDNEQD